MVDTSFPLLKQPLTGGPGARTTTFTTEEWPLGSLEEDFDASTGLTKKYIFVLNDTLVAWATGNIVSKTVGLGTTDYECELTPAAASAEGVVGVAVGAVAAGAYAWVGREGMFEVLSGAAGITADTGLIPGVAAGVAVDVAAIGNVSFGWSSETVVSPNPATCNLYCVG